MKRFRFFAVMVCLGVLSLGLTHLELADENARMSEESFKKAVEEYNLALKEPAGDKSEIKFRLGKLYYAHGDFENAIKCLSSVYAQRNDFSSARLLAISYYRTGSYTDALSVFDRHKDATDDEFLFFYGKTCEKHNLFDNALKLYGRIAGRDYKELAEERIASINATAQTKTVNDIKDEYVKKLIKTAPSQEAYPNAGAVVLLDEDSFEILPDSTAVYETHFVVKILNDRGRHFGEIQLDYDSTYEKVELEYARTIKPDNTIVLAGDKHIRDVSKYLNFPLYSNARVKIVSMPEVIDNAIIEYKAKWRVSKLINDKDFCDHYGIQTNEPCLNKKISVTVPSHFKFAITSSNPRYVDFKADFSPRIKEVNRKREYRWEFKNIPEIIDEPYMPPWSEIVAKLALSSFRSWDEIYKWWREMTKDKADTNKTMNDKVSELIRGRKTDAEKTEAIYHWCISKIRYVGVEYGEAGFEPHRASEIFANKYGDCKDKAILLISMLKQAGIKAHPVLIGTRGSWNMDSRFPSLTFNHAIAVEELEGRLVFMDATAETASFGDLPGCDQARDVLVFYEDTYRIITTPLFDGAHNMAEKNMRINIKKDETITGTRRVNTYGQYDQGQRYWLKYTKPVLVKERLKSSITLITPGGELVDYKVSDPENLEKPIELQMEFKGPKFLTEAGKDRIIPRQGGVGAESVSREKRSYPMNFGTLDELKTKVEINIPADFTVKFLPKAVVSENDWFVYRSGYSLSGMTITFEEDMLKKKPCVTVREYREYKKILESLAQDTDKQVILTK